MSRLTDVELEAIRERVREAREHRWDMVSVATTDRARLLTEVDALRAVIEAAPHPVKCASHNRVSPCNCWKARAIPAGTLASLPIDECNEGHRP